ncbi:MAG: peptidylprolyl isomerase [Candidatus Brocadiales bacterium]|nr:peptidylprolyl isomerase [Candidatus Bathyanammoxibius amoris]
MSILALSLAFTSMVLHAQGDRVVAIVNGEKVYNNAIEKRLKRLKGTDPSQMSGARDIILNEILTDIVVNQFVEKEGIRAKDEEVEIVINGMRKTLRDNPRYNGKTLEDILSAGGTSIEEFKKKINNTVALRKYFTQKVNYDVLIEHFNENKDAFTGEEVRASHILIDTQSLKSKKDYAAAFGRVHKIKKQLDDGADFAELAKTNSACPSAQKGGDLGFFTRSGMMTEPFAAAAFKLKVGEISEPVQTEFGFHIIKLTDRKGGGKVVFEDVKDQVEEHYIDHQIENLIRTQLSGDGIEIKGFD